MINGELPLVSVGIPTYNRPESLRRTLECITAQTYTNLEIIVSDNCSPGDDTESLVQEFIEKDSRIHFYRQRENKGPVFNFKFVLSKSKGEYFMWAADDDKWSKCYIEKIMGVFQSDEKKYVAVATEAQYIDNNLDRYDFFSEGKPFYNFYSEKKNG
jgi:glycosyltransferase involved in cell wall biosynthesis